MRFISYSILFLALSLACSLAYAGSWQGAFPANALDTHLTQSGLRIIVVSAGTRSASGPVAAELRSGLKASAKVKTVLSDSGLKNVSGLGDAQIVAECKRLPVDWVAVVRGFEGGTAVVIFYEKSGESALALTVARGTPLEPTLQEDGGEGVNRETAKQVADIRKEIQAEAKASHKKYQEEYLKLADYGGGSKKWFKIQQGRYGERVRLRDFYKIIGRQDLLDRYDTARTASWIIGFSGGATILAAVALARYWPFETKCGIARCSKSYLVPLGLAATGGLGIMYATNREPSPVSPTEMKALIKDYNHKLQNDLDLSEADLPKESPTKMSFTPFLLEGGAGMTMQLEW